MTIRLEESSDAAAVEALLDAAFGADRHGKTVYRLREGVAPIAALCFVAYDGAGHLRGSLRFWPITVARQWPALLLGPIAVRPEDRGLGYGRGLMWHGLAEATRLGHPRVILVGDEPYYGQFGFRAVLARDLALPGPYDQHRLLALALQENAMAGVTGMIGPGTGAGGTRLSPPAARPISD